MNPVSIEPVQTMGTVVNGMESSQKGIMFMCNSMKPVLKKLPQDQRETELNGKGKIPVPQRQAHSILQTGSHSGIEGNYRQNNEWLEKGVEGKMADICQNVVLTLPPLFPVGNDSLQNLEVDRIENHHKSHSQL